MTLALLLLCGNALASGGKTAFVDTQAVYDKTKLGKKSSKSKTTGTPANFAAEIVAKPEIKFDTTTTSIFSRSMTSKVLPKWNTKLPK